MEDRTEKRLYTLLILAVLAFALVNSFMIYATYIGAPKAIPEQKVIVVSGTGSVTADPDRAYVTFAVWTDGATASEAQALNAEKMSRVIKALTDAGVPVDSIKTTGYSVEPVIQYVEKEQPRIVGYVVRNQIEVMLTDIASVGSIIDVSVAGGANAVQSVYFTISDSRAEELKDQAIGEAAKDAESKAEAIAKSLNVKIIGPVSITLGYEYPIPRTKYETMTGGEPTPIIPGPLTVTANVQVTYSIS